MRTPNSPLFKRSEILMAVAFAVAFVALATLHVIY